MLLLLLELDPDPPLHATNPTLSKSVAPMIATFFMLYLLV
ncbi:hypothetical protein R0011_12840 [Lacticaseibacillus rhamnosus R0011]|nr:hypothetical protein R0011_12840 [Lacticaseibacillus rhamnosus R0011]